MDLIAAAARSSTPPEERLPTTITRVSPRSPSALSVVAVESAAELAPYVPAWQTLAENALEPNVFCEPWMLLPALDAFGTGRRLLCVLVFAPDPEQLCGPPLLCGLFPLERLSSYKGLPLGALRLWRHVHCFLGTPLLRAEYAPQCLEVLFDWLRRDRRGAALLELGAVAADGPFHQCLCADVQRHGRAVHELTRFGRALLLPAQDGETYLQNALSGGKRKELRRQKRRLAEEGKFEYVTLQPEGDVDAWIEQFLQLEALGWKGQQGSALRSDEAQNQYFRTICRDAFRRGRLMMLSYLLDGRPIAMKCNFLAGNGAFAFKIAYDETYSRHSPGVQLELDNILAVHDRPGRPWMDSCAEPGHPMIDGLWPDRRIIHSLLASTGSRRGNLAVRLLPTLRRLYDKYFRRPASQSPTALT